MVTELKEPTKVNFVRMPKSFHTKLKDATTNAPGGISMNQFSLTAIEIALQAKKDFDRIFEIGKGRMVDDIVRSWVE